MEPQSHQCPACALCRRRPRIEETSQSAEIYQEMRNALIALEVQARSRWSTAGLFSRWTWSILLEALEGQFYGKVVNIMRRKCEEKQVLE